MIFVVTFIIIIITSTIANVIITTVIVCIICTKNTFNYTITNKKGQSSKNHQLPSHATTISFAPRSLYKRGPFPVRVRKSNPIGAFRFRATFKN